MAARAIMICHLFLCFLEIKEGLDMPCILFSDMRLNHYISEGSFGTRKELEMVKKLKHLRGDERGEQRSEGRDF